MKLSELKIKNFRMYQEERVFNFYDFTSIIGANNCGKSTLLRAIEIFLNQDKPTDSDWSKGFEKEEIVISGIFTDIQDWERDVSGVAGIIQNDQIQLRVRYDIGTKKANYEAYLEIESFDGIDFNCNWKDVSKEISDELKELGINSAADWKTTANKERIKQLLRDRRPEIVSKLDAQWTSENISIDAALKQALPRVEIIPAVRDASDDAKPQAKTTFGKLLNSIIMPAIQKTPEYEELNVAVKKLSKILRSKKEEETAIPEISKMVEDITNRMTDLVDIKAILDLGNPETEKIIGASAVLRLDDGIETDISYQGHGVQRALIFSLIELIANQNNIVKKEEKDQIRATIILYEEPELFLHPHLMRRLKDSLIKISQKHAWQVVISTHSPFLINVVDNPKSLILTRKVTEMTPIIHQLTEDPFTDESKVALRAALDFHPTVAEAFFAKKVVLVEGDTEMAVFKHSNEIYLKFGISHDNFYNTTVVSCGGKWTIPAIALYLNKLAIPYRVIHDCDAKGRTQAELDAIELNIDPYKANKKILDIVSQENLYVVDDTFEDLLWERVDGAKISSKDKPFKSWLKIKEIGDKDEKYINENYAKLKYLFEFVYNW